MTKKEADKYIARMEDWYNKERALSLIPYIQAEIYVMCGMGTLGASGATQPSGFHINWGQGRLPYRKTDIKSTVRILARLVKIAELEEPLEFNTFNFIGV